MLHPLLETVFTKLGQERIDWCLLHQPTSLSAPQGDIDLLVDRDDASLIPQILVSLGFVAVPGRAAPPEMLFWACHPAAAHWIRLHIATEIAFGPFHAFQTGAEAECLERRQYDGTIATLAPDDAFWVLLLHCLLDKRRFSARYRTQLQQLAGAACADDGTSTLRKRVEAACPVGWNARRLVDAVQCGKWNTLARLSPGMARRWLQRDPANTLQHAFANAQNRIGSRLLNFSRRRGLSVTLLGPDGAGKSTLAAGIEKGFGFPVRHIYMGLRPGGAISKDGPRAPVLKKGYRLLEVALRPGLLWWRYLMAQYYQAAGRLVIFDRYTYDAMLPPRPPFVPLKRLYYSALTRLCCPAPDLVMVLDVPGNIMYQRKGEHTPATLEERRQQFLALRQRISHLQVVDATRTPDAIRDDVLNRIWQQYTIRWKERSRVTE